MKNQILQTAHQFVVEMLDWGLTEKVKKNQAYSRRALARDLGMSTAYLSLIFSGKKNLSIKKAKEIADRLHWPERERDRFLKAVILASIPKKLASYDELNEILYGRRKRADTLSISQSQIELFTSWKHCALLILTTNHDFKSDISWIADRLNLSILEVEKTIKDLIEVGLLIKNDCSYEARLRHFYISNDMNDRAVVKLRLNQIEKGLSVIQNATKKKSQSDQFLLSGLTISINPEKINEATNLIEKFRYDMADLLTVGWCTEVYQLNIQLVPFTKI